MVNALLDDRFAIGEYCGMRLIVSPAAAKALSRMPRKEAGALMAKLGRFADDPGGRHRWARRLTNRDDFRIRQGDWRAVFRLDRETDEMVVDLIAARKEAYR